MSHKINCILAVALIFFATHVAAQDCKTNVSSSTPNSNFTDHGDGTVTDTNTGLMWIRCSEGQTFLNNGCTGNANGYSWSNALTHANSRNFAGKTDWRLPNLKELSSIVERACSNPAINLTQFPNTTSLDIYWTSSPYNADVSRAWGVFSYYGNDYIRAQSTEHQVRLVRGGQ